MLCCKDFLYREWLCFKVIQKTYKEREESAQVNSLAYLDAKWGRHVFCIRALLSLLRD